MNTVIFILSIGILAAVFAYVVSGRLCKKNKRKEFGIKDIAKMVTQCEGKKVNLSIAQVNEVLKVLNTLTGGRFYKWVKTNVN